MAAVCFGSLPARGNPGDIFQLGAPVIGSSAPKGADINAGNTAVSATGAFTYSYPIGVPPGRRGMQPSLALSYSSQASIYGDIAAGWTLSGLHVISRDASKSRIFANETFVSSLAGRPLVQVTEPWTSEGSRTVYRAQGDTAYTRYERMNAGPGPRWRAYASDGTIYYFGDSDHHTCGSQVSDRWAPLTRTEDKFGNVVEYFYKGLGPAGAPIEDCHIDYITWGQNANAGVGSFAAMKFHFTEVASCASAPHGAQISWRSGAKVVRGSRRLSMITAAAFPPGSAAAPPQVIPTARDHTREITLSYDTTTETCGASHAGYRSLSKISERAWGTDSPLVTLPAVAFTYGKATFGSAPLAWPSTTTSYTARWLAWGPGNRSWNNLGWGYRYRSGPLPSVEAMMIDLDGDGLLDRLTNASPAGAGANSVSRCTARWERNQGDFRGFEYKGEIELPTLKWASSPLTYSGGSYSNQHTTELERCALNYQRTNYDNSYDPGSSGFACPDTGYCPASGYCSNGNDCTGKNAAPGPTTLAYRWFDIDGDLLPDLVVSPTIASFKSYNLQFGSQSNQVEPAIFAPYPWTSTYPCPNPTYSAYPQDPNQNYTMCNGMFPWIIYKNFGNGIFGTSQGAGNNPLPTKIIYQPIPLETANGDSSLTSMPVGQYQGTVDVDGDGYVDSIRQIGGTWQMFGNDGSGRFVPYSQGAPYLFPTPYTNSITESNFVLNGPNNPITVEGLFDLHGDGLLDHWRGTSESVLANQNDGMQLRSEQLTLNHRPGTDGVSGAPNPCPGGVPCAEANGWINNAWRTDLRRPVDMDLDGRQDLISRPTTSSGFVTHINQGGQLAPGLGASYAEPGQGHRIVVSTATVPGAYTWEVRSDFIDFDGDGIGESIDFGAAFPQSGNMLVSKIETPTTPPRLMASINNGRGATTTISYSPMRAPVVKQEPELGVPANDPELGAKALAQTQWVVASHTTTDLLTTPQTVSTASYAYERPRTTKVDGSFAFRGFEKVTTTSPSGARREDFYNFDLDRTGRLEMSIVRPSPSEGANDARTIDITEWDEFALYGGLIKTYHPVSTEHLVCFNGQTSCAPGTAAGYKKTTITMSAVSSNVVGGQPLMWQPVQSLVQTGAAAADGDRRKDTTYFLNATSTAYRLVTEQETGLHRSGGSFVMSSRRSVKWTDQTDQSYRVPYSETVWTDTNLANAATTYRTYDLGTGNVKHVWKPKQWAANSSPAANLERTSLEYDARKLFIATETNALGHVVQSTYEYGTGTKLGTFGPNAPSCAATSTCPANSPLKEEHRIRVDGTGRMIERYESFTWGPSEYVLRKVETNTYVDGPYPTIPSVTHENAIDYNEYTQVTRYARDKTELSGTGRPTRSIVYVSGSAPADHVTTYQYSNAGMLSAVTVPDPRSNTSATVTYRYTFDSLGRPTSMRRPDAALPSQTSGIDMSYNGLTTTKSEVVAFDMIWDGNRASTVTRANPYGSVVEVQEKRSESPITWAVTTYAYDANDNVKQITDPQGAVTTLTHDFAGRRTSISRAGKTWRYGYDKNGNVEWEQTPCAPLGSCEANHTTTFAYDALDRISSKLVAPRTLSSTDLALFGSSTETFTYDAGDHGKGRLSTWQSFAPGATTATLRTMPTYNAQGQVLNSNQQINAAGYAGLQRNLLRIYNISGALRGTYHRDIVGTSSCQNGSYSEISYDARGLPASVQMNSCLYGASAPFSYLVNERNVAGLVTKRSSVAGAGPFWSVEALWSYDAIGRVAQYGVRKAPSVDVFSQTATYYGNDNPKSLSYVLSAPASQQTYQFHYDYSHQLTQVTDSTSSSFTARYAYDLAGRFLSAEVAATALPNSDVKARDVTYVYSPSDPEQLLTLSAGNRTYASYTYDLAGNQLSRNYPKRPHPATERADYVYDGKNQLRRATKIVNGAVQGSEEYWYDATGARMLVVTRNAAGTKTGARWFIGDTEAEYDAAGNVTRAYAYVSLGTPVARFDRTTDAPANVVYQFYGRANNMVAAVSQATGTTDVSFSYGPFGEIVHATNAGGGGSGIATQRRRMNDKFVDDVTNLAYYGARYFDRISMMWTQGDPLYRLVPDLGKSGSPRDANLYVFTRNNPMRFIDPDGRMTAPGVKDYQSENDIRDAYRAALEADANWTVKFEKKNSFGSWGNFLRLENPCNGITSVCEHDLPSTDSSEADPIVTANITDPVTAADVWNPEGSERACEKGTDSYGFPAPQPEPTSGFWPNAGPTVHIGYGDGADSTPRTSWREDYLDWAKETAVDFVTGRVIAKSGLRWVQRLDNAFDSFNDVKTGAEMAHEVVTGGGFDTTQAVEWTVGAFNAVLSRGDGGPRPQSERAPPFP